jgi:hypothetical protein
LKEDFLSVYKELRNRWRAFRPQSIVVAAMELLQEKVKDKVADLRRAPWQVLLLVKWVLQDEWRRTRRAEKLHHLNFMICGNVSMTSQSVFPLETKIRRPRYSFDS